MNNMILVTGGTGMLGAHLLMELVNKGESIRAIMRDDKSLHKVKTIFSFYHANFEELYSKIEWICADILNIESLEEAFIGIDRVYHVAAIVSFDPRDKYTMINNNVNGTANVVNASLKFGIKKLCHVSSVSALGHGEMNAETNEETFRNPKDRFSGYSISKFRSELEVWRGITEGLEAVIVNPSIILGPGDWQSGSPSIFLNIAKGLKFYTKGITGYVDVRDVVRSMIGLMESEIHSERFVVSSENLSFRELFNRVAESIGVKKPSIYANLFLLELAWRFEALKSRLTGKPPLVSKDSINTANNSVFFSSKKIIDALNFKFTSIDECILSVAGIFKKDNQ
jgi:dihydroflavonol-4-reductase